MLRILIVFMMLCVGCATVNAEQKPAAPGPTETQLWQVFEYSQQRAKLAAYEYKEALAALQKAKADLAEYYKTQAQQEAKNE